MFIKIITFSIFLNIISGSGIYNTNEKSNKIGDYYAPANYKFSYGVDDQKTGDYKSHKEEKIGDVVKGEYSVLDPDGTLRTVTYIVDKDSGFQAVVKTMGKNNEIKEQNFGHPISQDTGHFQHFEKQNTPQTSYIPTYFENKEENQYWKIADQNAGKDDSLAYKPQKLINNEEAAARLKPKTIVESWINHKGSSLSSVGEPQYWSQSEEIKNNIAKPLAKKEGIKNTLNSKALYWFKQELPQQTGVNGLIEVHKINSRNNKQQPWIGQRLPQQTSENGWAKEQEVKNKSNNKQKHWNRQELPKQSGLNGWIEEQGLEKAPNNKQQYWIKQKLPQQTGLNGWIKEQKNENKLKNKPNQWIKQKLPQQTGENVWIKKQEDVKKINNKPNFWIKQEVPKQNGLKEWITEQNVEKTTNITPDIWIKQEIPQGWTKQQEIKDNVSSTSGSELSTAPKHYNPTEQWFNEAKDLVNSQSNYQFQTENREHSTESGIAQKEIPGKQFQYPQLDLSSFKFDDSLLKPEYKWF